MFKNLLARLFSAGKDGTNKEVSKSDIKPTKKEVNKTDIVVFRNFLEEVDQCRDIRECLDSCLNHSCDFAEVVVSFEDLLHVWKCFLVEFFRIHFFDVLAVHPAEFGDIKDCR